MNYENLSHKKSKAWLKKNLKEDMILFCREEDVFIKILKVGREKNGQIDTISKLFFPNGKTMNQIHWIIFKNWNYREVT